MFSDLHCTFSASSPIPVLKRCTVSIRYKTIGKAVVRFSLEQWDLISIANRKSFSFLERDSFLEIVHRNIPGQCSD